MNNLKLMLEKNILDIPNRNTNHTWLIWLLNIPWKLYLFVVKEMELIAFLQPATQHLLENIFMA